MGIVKEILLNNIDHEMEINHCFEVDERDNEDLSAVHMAMENAIQNGEVDRDYGAYLLMRPFQALEWLQDNRLL